MTDSPFNHEERDSRDSRDFRDEHRRELQRQTIVGFLGFLSFMAVVQAVLNVFRPEPAVWPAVLALVLVVLTVTVWRATRRR